MNNSSSSSVPFIPWGPKVDNALFAVFVIVGCLIIMGNFITILTFAINRHLRRRSVYCLLHLAVVDMLFGVIVIINQMLLFNSVVILFFFFLFVACLSALTLVAVERVYATFFPWRQRTTTMYLAAFIIAWLIAVPELIPMSYDTDDDEAANERDLYILGTYLVCLVTICTSYTAIFIKVKVQAKRLLNQTNQQQTPGVQLRQKREQHLAMTLFIVTVASLIAWLPYTSLSISELTVTSYSDKFYNTITVQIALLIQSTNSLINPIIYVFRMRDFRRALSRLMLKCLRDQQIHPVGHHGN